MSSIKFKPHNTIFLVLSLILIGGPIVFLLYRQNRNSGIRNISYASADNATFNPTHVVNVTSELGRITVRNKAMTALEYKLGNSSTTGGDILNNQTIIGYIYNGTNVELIEQHGASFKIRYNSDNKIIEGYIAVSFAGKPTLYPLGNSYKSY